MKSREKNTKEALKNVLLQKLPFCFWFDFENCGQAHLNIGRNLSQQNLCNQKKNPEKNNKRKT